MHRISWMNYCRCYCLQRCYQSFFFLFLPYPSIAGVGWLGTFLSRIDLAREDTSFPFWGLYLTAMGVQMSVLLGKISPAISVDWIKTFGSWAHAWHFLFLFFFSEPRLWNALTWYFECLLLTFWPSNQNFDKFLTLKQFF